MHPFVLGLGHLGLNKNLQSEIQDLDFLREAIASGVMAFDTSNNGGNGGTERLLGQVIKDRREFFYISTKAGYREDSWTSLIQFTDSMFDLSRRDPLNPDDDNVVPVRHSQQELSPTPYSEELLPGQDFSAKAIRDSLMGSLARLDIESVDSFMLDSPPTSIDNEAIDCMTYLYEWNLCGRIGVSCRTFNDAYHFLLQPWVQVVQVPFVSNFSAMNELCSLAHKRGKKVMVRELIKITGYREWVSPQSTLLLSRGLSFTLADLIRDIFLFPAVESVVVRTRNMQHLAENMLVAMYAKAKRGIKVLDDADVL